MNIETINQLVNELCDEYCGASHIENKMRQKLEKSISFLILYGYQKGFDKCLEEYAVKLSFAEEYENELRIAKADIMNLTEEIERLKSWEHFTKTLSVMQTFQSLGKHEKEAISLMIDGIKFRKQKGE